MGRPLLFQRGTAPATLLAATTAMFTDGLLYGVVIPLARHSPAGLDAPWTLGAMYGSYAVGTLAVTPLMGLLADRVGRRRPMIAGVLVQMAAVLVFAFGTSLPALLVARLAQGAAAAAPWTAGLALVAERHREGRTTALSYTMMGNTLGLVVGPLAGGLLLSHFGYRVPFAVVGLVLVVDFLLRYGLIADLPGRVAVAPQLRPLLGDPTVITASLVVILGAWCWSALEPLYPGYLESAAGSSPTAVGAVFTGASLVYGFGCPLFGYVADHAGPWPTMRGGLVLMALTLPLLSLPRTAWGAGLLFAVISVAYGLAVNPTLTVLGDAVDRRGTGAYATVYAVFNIVYSLGMIGGNLLAGVLASVISLRAALLLTSVVILGCLPLTRRRPSLHVRARPYLRRPVS